MKIAEVLVALHDPILDPTHKSFVFTLIGRLRDLSPLF